MPASATDAQSLIGQMMGSLRRLREVAEAVAPKANPDNLAFQDSPSFEPLFRLCPSDLASRSGLVAFVSSQIKNFSGSPNAPRSYSDETSNLAIAFGRTALLALIDSSQRSCPAISETSRQLGMSLQLLATQDHWMAAVLAEVARWEGLTGIPGIDITSALEAILETEAQRLRQQQEDTQFSTIPSDLIESFGRLSRRSPASRQLIIPGITNGPVRGAGDSM